MVGHGHITVNGKKVDIPSFVCKVGDKISVKQKEPQIKRVQASMEKWKDLNAPEWLALDREKLIGTITRLPTKATPGFLLKKLSLWNCIQSRNGSFTEKFFILVRIRRKYNGYSLEDF